MEHSKNLAIVLVSGGLDSCVTAALAHQTHDLAFLHVNYGQRTARRELKSFTDIADYYKVKRRLLADCSYLKKIGGSSLLDPSIPIEKQSILNTGTIPSTYVPFRNTHLIAIATSWAEIIKAQAIFIGAVEQDSSGYPDCRKGYFTIFQKLIEEGTRPETHISLKTPVITMKKSGIIKKALALKAPIHLTWSCYQKSRRACGVCESCRLRLRGFHEAGVVDPIPYSIKKTSR
ncbi:MAG: 7-cyano-7-deazaguanine synthase QueC [Thermodesulfobacteriota bacterium]|nr:7-cyano-7-deazaguanine synthase QueC [Thermodesulfobacteriota bacterium]